MSVRRVAAGRRTAMLSVVSVAVALLALVVPSGRSSAATPAASTIDPNGPAGLNLTQAFTLTRGAPSSVIGYVEGGINWHTSSSSQLANKVAINWREVPEPCAAASAAGCRTIWPHRLADDDRTGDGATTVADWAGDPRVLDRNGNGFIDPEDLIVAFRDGRDQDHNGFADDIAGWDFYDDQPDPATVDSTYTHANNQMLNALAQCPGCLVLPVKAGDEALDATDKLAEAWLYAANRHVSVITSVTADLGYSSFMRQAVDSIAKRGIAMVESSNDFDSTDHQGGMFWPGVVPGNGAIADPSGTKFVRSNLTSWGTHNLFTIAGQDSTSASTSATGGLVGLVMAWGQQEFAAGRIAHPLSGQQAIQVLRETSKPVTDPTLGWPGSAGEWNLQYGYGIPDLYAAMQAVTAGSVPPVAAITSPDWYSLYDPASTARVPVRGRITASPGRSWSYRLQLGIGPQPAAFTTIGAGRGSGSWSGRVGTVDLRSVPRSFSDAAMTISSDQSLPSAEQYALTLRLVVTPDDDAAHPGVDRRAVYDHHDPNLAAGFPLRLGDRGPVRTDATSGGFAPSLESGTTVADLTGRPGFGHVGFGRTGSGAAIVAATSDGVVHALDARTGRELPGWPVTTDRLRIRGHHRGVDPGHEPVLAEVAVGDLRGDGQQDVVATSLDGRVYAWDSRGRRLPGWPRTLDTGVTAPAIPRPALPYTRQPLAGAVAAPVLANLDSGRTGPQHGPLYVVQAGWDGYLHAYAPDGHERAGFPVRVQLPAGTAVPFGYSQIDDQKLDATPALAYFDGPDHPPSIVLRSQYSQTTGPGITFGAFGFAFAYRADGSLRPGWPAKLPSLIEYYDSAQEFITEGSSSPVAADVSGTGTEPDRVAISTVFSLPLLLDGDGRTVGAYGVPLPELPDIVDPSKLFDLLTRTPPLPVAFTTSGSFGTIGGSLRYVQAGSSIPSLASALLNRNSGQGIQHVETVYPAAGGDPAPGFPATRQGLNFLGSPIVADVTGDGAGEAIDGGDSNALAAYTASGQQARGFPAFTTGWNLFSPTAADLSGSGRTTLLAGTREGYLYAWTTNGTDAGNAQWPHWQHDNHNSGNYGVVVPHR